MRSVVVRESKNRLPNVRDSILRQIRAAKEWAWLLNRCLSEVRMHLDEEIPHPLPGLELT